MCGMWLGMRSPGGGGTAAPQGPLAAVRMASHWPHQPGCNFRAPMRRRLIWPLAYRDQGGNCPGPNPKKKKTSQLQPQPDWQLPLAHGWHSQHPGRASGIPHWHPGTGIWNPVTILAQLLWKCPKGPALAKGGTPGITHRPVVLVVLLANGMSRAGHANSLALKRGGRASLSKSPSRPGPPLSPIYSQAT